MWNASALVKSIVVKAGAAVTLMSPTFPVTVIEVNLVWADVTEISWSALSSLSSKLAVAADDKLGSLSLIIVTLRVSRSVAAVIVAPPEAVPNLTMLLPVKFFTPPFNTMSPLKLWIAAVATLVNVIEPSWAPTVFPPRPVEANVPAAVPLVNDAGPFKAIVASTLFPEASWDNQLPKSRVASFLVVIVTVLLGAVTRAPKSTLVA